MGERKCKNCGKVFSTKNKVHIYCSNKCKFEYYKRNRKPKIRICDYCGKKFISKNTRSKYCSKSCYEEGNRVNTKKRMYKLRKEFPELYYNTLGTKGTSDKCHLYRDDEGKPDFEKEGIELKHELARLGLV
ncbi:MAG: hypothetical protein K8E24_014455 [Methanobacterium paludis]|nr:hypothetical protein [Methanobacterium paludis]